MSLGKLLASGKSFVNGRSKAAYREDKRVYLPKFGLAKNPFTAPVQTELPKVEAQESVAPCEKIAASAQPAKSLATWTRKLNPVSVWRDSQEGKSAPRLVIQADLSLDTVKVVHNDLSDADVEIVPIKSRPPREMSESVLQVDGGGNSWSRLGAKFFGANAV
jgi:hypothetical protein